MTSRVPTAVSWLRSAASLSLLFVAPACAELLDLSPGLGSAEHCRSDDDCEPGSDCKSSECVQRACEPGAKDCQGLSLMRCTDDHAWEERQRCSAMCSNQQCVTPNSCQGDSITCAGLSCCKTEQVDETSFGLVYAVEVDDREDGTEAPLRAPRTVRPFAMDRFEVTVSRFRAFIRAYEREGIPEPGAGRHPAFPGSGWDVEWSDSLPRDPNSVVSELRGQGLTFGDDRPEDLPIRGVSWFLAYAFCIWDGARLPTEAEWSAAAQGGDEERAYPWRTEPVRIDATFAVYSEGEMLAAPEPVGSRPAGAGRFEHRDLAGNVAEWVADTYEETLPARCANEDALTLNEHECLERERDSRRVLRGGSYRDGSATLRNVVRRHLQPSSGLPHVGFRCVRDLPAP